MVASFPLVSGCGGGRVETVPVRGRVTFDGRACPAAGTVAFLPLEPAEGYPMRPATGKFDTDGYFSVTSYRSGDGLVPGRYRVRILCWKEPPEEEGAGGVNYVPDGYQAEELVIEPGADGPVEVAYDVPAIADP